MNDQTLCTPIWLLIGMSGNVPGVLELADGRLSFTHGSLCFFLAGSHPRCACMAPDFRTRTPGFAVRMAVSNAAATARAWIGRIAFGTIQLIGPRSRAAHISPTRNGCPTA